MSDEREPRDVIADALEESPPDLLDAADAILTVLDAAGFSVVDSGAWDRYSRAAYHDAPEREAWKRDFVVNPEPVLMVEVRGPIPAGTGEYVRSLPRCDEHECVRSVCHALGLHGGVTQVWDTYRDENTE